MTTDTGTWAMRPTMAGESSRRMVDIAVAEAAAMSVAVTVVIVDESGVLKEMYRMDGAPLVSVQTAMSKAYAAAAIGCRPMTFTRPSSQTGRRSPRSRRVQGWR